MGGYCGELDSRASRKAQSDLKYSWLQCASEPLRPLVSGQAALPPTLTAPMHSYSASPLDN